MQRFCCDLGEKDVHVAMYQLQKISSMVNCMIVGLMLCLFTGFMLGAGSIKRGCKPTRDSRDFFLLKTEQAASPVSYIQLPEPDEKQ